MKKLVKLSMILAGALGCLNMSAAVLNFNGSPGVAIPDNDASGVAFGFTVTTGFGSIDSVVVTFNISGGYNGDLYAYLSHGSGLAILLNRVGVTGSDPNGYSDSGFNNVMLFSGAASDIHQYQVTQGGPGVPTGNWSADGRLAPTDLTRPNTLDVFTGADPNGDWTLFLADRDAGSIATLQSWAVDISAIPEPANIALGIFGVLVALTKGMRILFTRSRRN